MLQIRQYSDEWPLKKMGLTRRFLSMSSVAALILVMLACIQVADASNYDGRPRPVGFRDAPTAAYGKLPLIYTRANFAADCDWYGWASVNYPENIGTQCLAYIWKTKVLDEAGRNTLIPYKYYNCKSILEKGTVCYDNVVHEEYCNVGCFYLDNSTTVLPAITTPDLSNVPATPGTSANSDGGAFQQPSSALQLVGCAVAGAAALLFNQPGRAR